MIPTPEQKARQDIDAALRVAGWIGQDRSGMNLAAGLGVAVREFKMTSGHGFADYLLFVNGKAVGRWRPRRQGIGLSTSSFKPTNTRRACRMGSARRFRRCPSVM
jgi:type I restriction enzyme, R subunit